MNISLITLGTAAMLAMSTGASATASAETLLGDALANGTNFALTTAGEGEARLSSTNALWIDGLESALGVSPLALGADAYEGSALQRTFTLAAGSTLSFNWTLSTDVFDAGFADLAFADLAFAVVDGDVVQLGTVGINSMSGSFSRTFATAGTYTLSVGVVDVNDVTGVSRLDVSTVTAVPEPETFAMLLAGLGLVGAAARRRRI